ncbi:hypothetical protein SDC9_183491 [bioreactor metagenome]|uniref:Uncharacterized protein n=1 Tax=bioreactor metagenome TaxID=1076179 RepID=A0A645HBT9_9ZZZZ
MIPIGNWNLEIDFAILPVVIQIQLCATVRQNGDRRGLCAHKCEPRKLRLIITRCGNHITRVCLARSIG